jgi:hypothetical protein
MPIFTTRIKRRGWALRLPQGDEVECVLNIGNIECSSRKVPISEIELELKAGDPTHLFDFALALHQDIPMQIGNLSKADRGYALYAPQLPAAIKATLILFVNQRPKFSSRQREYFPVSLTAAAVLHRGNDPLHRSLIFTKTGKFMALFDTLPLYWSCIRFPWLPTIRLDSRL